MSNPRKIYVKMYYMSIEDEKHNFGQTMAAPAAPAGISRSRRFFRGSNFNRFILGLPYFLLLAPGLKLAPPSNKRLTLEQNYFISAAL